MAIRVVSGAIRLDPPAEKEVSKYITRVDSNGTSISHIGNPTNQLLLDVFFYDSTEEDPNIFVLSETPTTIEQVTINDVATTNYTLHDLNQITINSTLTDGDKISITYKFAGETVYYTFGYRKDGGGTEEDDYFTVGQYSFASGCLISATGIASHAEGYNTEAKGHSSHAEGHETIAWRDYAHVGGDGCQAEGEASHAEGVNTYAIGDYSHAQNEYTVAEKCSQTTIGTYNIRDRASSTTHPSGDTDYGIYALIIGNGTSDTARSNAFTVDWTGNIRCGNYWGQYKSIFDIFYPVGSYYETSLPPELPSGASSPTSEDLTNLGVTWFDPYYAWGGSWVLEIEGQVHVSAGTGYIIGGALTNTSDGGAATVKLVTANMPAHSHEPSVTSENFVTSGDADANNTRVAYSSSGNRWVDGLTSQSHFHHRAATNSVGSGTAHENMPPYIVVNRWHRIA